VESELRNLLYSSIEAWAYDRELDVAYPNVNFETERGSKNPINYYLKASVMPLTPDTTIICDGGSIYEWLWQVSVFYRDGVGEIKPYKYVDDLRAFYHVLFEFIGEEQKYVIVRTPPIIPPVLSPGWYSIPVQFRILTSC